MACIEDPFAERDDFAGSDRRRISMLATQLVPDHSAWRALPRQHRGQGETALAILSNPDP
ncbi:hypothetical protein ACFXPS_06870 [Nocardia sp. NPDC059091]|uniref:hypothetical protein n=1 Tax=Nocardia sp. NPDC059091 TaxID=3346724 RepID=UPI0036ABC155